MADYLLLMHDDATDPALAEDGALWARYLARLREEPGFGGGSAIGPGVCERKTGAPRPLSAGLGGFLRVQAESLDDARRFLVGNPVYEGGGTVEIRLLPRDG
jgi:hypothetical protein